MKQLTSLFMMLLAAAMILSGAGCSRLTKQNYDKIRMGQDYGEVTAILGDDATCSAAMGAKSCTWGDDEKNITVKFIAGKVVLMTCTGI